MAPRPPVAPDRPGGPDAPAAAPAVRTGHLGICVADLERSLRFYTEGLGFDVGVGIDLGDECARALEVPPDVRLRSQFLTKDGLTVELLAFTRPAADGRPSTRRNQLGLTHLSMHVDDIDQGIRRLVGAGGAVLAATRTELKDPAGTVMAEFVFCTDPDGVRIELMRP